MYKLERAVTYITIQELLNLICLFVFKESDFFNLI
jgi:hypothetical protein